jgi:hypothetical protein
VVVMACGHEVIDFGIETALQELGQAKRGL